MHYLDEANQEEAYMKKKSALSICLALLVFLLFSFAGCDSLTEAIFGQQGQKDNRISSFELVEKYFPKYRDKVGELIEKYVGEYTLEDDNDYTPTDNYFVDYTYTYAIDDDFYMELELTYDTDGGSANSFCFIIRKLTKDIEILKDMCERYSALMSEVVNFCAYDIRIEEGLYLELYDEVYEKYQNNPDEDRWVIERYEDPAFIPYEWIGCSAYLIVADEPYTVTGAVLYAAFYLSDENVWEE